MAEAMAILGSILAAMGIFGVFLVIGWIIFGYLDKIHNWMHRRDLNRNVRKDTHIQYINTVDKLFKDIDENGKITDDESLIILVAMINSAAGSVKAKRLKKRLFNKHIILKQLKYATRDGVSTEFKLNKNVQIDKLLKKTKLFKEVKSMTEADASKLLILIATAAFTEQAEVIRYDHKYDSVVRQINHIHELPKKDLLYLFKLR